MDSSFLSTNATDSCESTASADLPDLGKDTQTERLKNDLDTEEPKPTTDFSLKTNGLSIDNNFKKKCLHYDESEIKLKELLRSTKSITAKEQLIRSLR
jgi:hypothetical protein